MGDMVKIEIWSDVVCVWCYIGQRRLEKALARFEHARAVELVWRSFQLDPSHPKKDPTPAPVIVAQKTGASAEQIRSTADRMKTLAAHEGLEYDFERSVVVNTFDAHRLIHMAHTYDLGTEMHRRL